MDGQFAPEGDDGRDWADGSRQRMDADQRDNQKGPRRGPKYTSRPGFPDRLFADIRIEPPVLSEFRADKKMGKLSGKRRQFAPRAKESAGPPPEDYREGLSKLLPNWMVIRPLSSNLPSPVTMILIALALVSAILSPILAGNMMLALVFVAGFFTIIAGVALLKWPIVGLASLPIISLVVSYTLGTGSQTGINATAMLVLLLTGTWLLEMLVHNRQIRLLPFRPITASLLLIIVALVSFGFGQFNWFPTNSAPLTAQVGGLMIFMLSVCAFLVYAHQVRSINELQWINWIFLASGFLFLLMRNFRFLRPYVRQFFVQEASQGSVFFIWLVSLAAGQLLINKKLHPAVRILLGGLILLFFYQNMGIGRAWASGWLPVLVSLMVIVILYKPRLGIAIAALGAIVVLATPGLLSGLLSEGDNSYSIITRVEAWRILVEIIKVSPLLGVGMANYYWYTSMFRILGYQIQFNSHNNYIDIIAQTGLVGVTIFIWFLWEVWRVGWRTLSKAPEGFARAYVIAAIGGLAGTAFAGLLGDWVIPFVYNVGLNGYRMSVFAWVFLGGLLAVAKLVLPIDEKVQLPAAG
jgi:hypothetical protein